MTEATQPRTWAMYAARKNDGTLVNFFPHPNIVAMCTGKGDEVVPVVLTEDPDGVFAGWVDAEDGEVSMIERHIIFEIQFPYGSEAEVKRGRGEVVRLRAEEAEVRPSVMTLKQAVDILLHIAKEVDSDTAEEDMNVNLHDLERAIEVVENTRFADSGVF